MRFPCIGRLLNKGLFTGTHPGDSSAKLGVSKPLLLWHDVQVIDRISNRKARDFLHSMPPKLGRPFEEKFPNADRLALDLLKQLLSFEACERPSAAVALEHPYFSGLPKVKLPDSKPNVPQEFAFEAHKLSEADVRNLIYLEVRAWLGHLGQRCPALLCDKCYIAHCCQYLACPAGRAAGGNGCVHLGMS